MQQPYPLLMRTALFSCLPPLPDRQGARGEGWQGQEYELMRKEGCLRWCGTNGKNTMKTRRQRKLERFWNSYLSVVTSNRFRWMTSSLLTSSPPTSQSHIVDKTVGFFLHCLCNWSTALTYSKETAFYVFCKNRQTLVMNSGYRKKPTTKQ